MVTFLTQTFYTIQFVCLLDFKGKEMRNNSESCRVMNSYVTIECVWILDVVWQVCLWKG